MSDEKKAEMFSPYVILWQNAFRRWLEHADEEQLDEMFRLEKLVKEGTEKAQFDAMAAARGNSGQEVPTV